MIPLLLDRNSPNERGENALRTSNIRKQSKESLIVLSWRSQYNISEPYECGFAPVYVSEMRSQAATLGDGRTALGLPGWERTDGTLQAKGGLFRWYDESYRELFEQASEAGLDRVQKLFGTMCS